MAFEANDPKRSSPFTLQRAAAKHSRHIGYVQCLTKTSTSKTTTLPLSEWHFSFAPKESFSNSNLMMITSFGDSMQGSSPQGWNCSGFSSWNRTPSSCVESTSKITCFSLVRLGDQWKPSWWFQPIWKILVKLDNFPKQRWKKKHLKTPPWNLKLYTCQMSGGVFYSYKYVSGCAGWSEPTTCSFKVVINQNTPHEWMKLLLISIYKAVETHTPNNYIQYIVCNFLALVALIIDQFYAIHLSPCASSHRPSAWPQHLFGETTLRSHRARQCGWPREFSKTHKLHPETIIKWWNSWIYRPSLDLLWEDEGTSFSERISPRSSLSELPGSACHGW